jgi:hypothetical protein
MGPRLGRVEYLARVEEMVSRALGFNGATLRTRGIRLDWQLLDQLQRASMGPRLGRVEYRRHDGTGPGR